MEKDMNNMNNMSIICLLMILITSSGQAQINDTKKTIAVLEFKTTGDVSPKEAATLTNRFRSLLIKTSAFIVIEREKMLDILKEQDFKMTDACNSEECAIQVGQLLGAEQMIAGDIGKIGQTYTIDLRLIDVTNGSLLQSQQKNYKGEVDGLLDAMTEIANKFASTTSKKNNSKVLWYIVGGSLIAGGTSIVLFSGKDKKQTSTGIPSAGFPNNP